MPLPQLLAASSISIGPSCWRSPVCVVRAVDDHAVDSALGLEGAELGAKLRREVEARMDALDHLRVTFPQADPHVEGRVEARRSALADVRVERAQVAEVRHLVGGVDEDGALPARFDLIAVMLLAPLIRLDVLVLGHRIHQLANPGAEGFLDLVERDVRVLDDVVEERGGQDLLVVVARLVEQPGELRWMPYVGRAVALPLLALVRLAGELVRLVGKARAGEELWCLLLHRPGYRSSERLCRESSMCR